MRSTRWYVIVGLIVGSAILIFTHLLAQETQDSLDQPSMQIKQPAKAVLLAVTKAGDRLVAVGERGIIITSDDHGQTWKQAIVPVSESLTAVQFVSPTEGWAVGHSGVILNSSDGGQTWKKQLDGRTASKLCADALNAKFQGKTTPDAMNALQSAQRLSEEGPDKPFLNLYFEDARTGYAVGAYGMIVRTEDGGQTWASLMDRFPGDVGFHIYSIAKVGNSIYIAGEQGVFYQSSDEGKSFVKVETPYNGSYFDMAVTPSKEIVLSAMKGNIYRYNGKTFTKLENPSSVNLTASAWLGDGSLLFVNQAGQLLISHDQGKTVSMIDMPPLPPSSGLVDAGNGNLITAGVAGIVPVSLHGQVGQGGSK